MQKYFIYFFLAINFTSSERVIIVPKDTSGKSIAILWIHGANCKAEAYKTIAIEFQKQAYKNGYSAWIVIPQFDFKFPDPEQIDKQVQEVLTDLKNKYGYEGQQYYLITHSLGGVMAQIFAKGKKDKIKGLIMTCQLLLNNSRTITQTGNTKFDFDIPTLTLVGEIDGLLRISKSAEYYWHQQINIDESQKGLFPLLVLKGMSHASFMDRRMLTPAVSNLDINPEIEENQGHINASQLMIDFINTLEVDKNNKNNYPQRFQKQQKYTEKFMQPFIDGMYLEGSYKMKQPCNNKKLIKKQNEMCTKGSLWSQYAQSIMGGNIYDKNVTIQTQDYFHIVNDTQIIFNPSINNSCTVPKIFNCTLSSISITQNIYTNDKELTTKQNEVGAFEMQVKLVSRQFVQQRAGSNNANFIDTDEIGSRCAEINQKSLQWALNNSNKEAIERYLKYGKQLVIDQDLGPFNEENIWIQNQLTFKDNEDKTKTIVQSPTLRTPVDYYQPQLAGFHFCKLLSPFRALEWIYHDSQLDHNGIRNHLNKIKLVTY